MAANKAAQERAQLLADVERIARTFHETYERFAPLYNYQTRRESAVPWEDVPPSNAELMRAVVEHLLGDEVIKVGHRPEESAEIPGQTSIEDHLDE